MIEEAKTPPQVFESPTASRSPKSHKAPLIHRSHKGSSVKQSRDYFKTMTHESKFVDCSPVKPIEFKYISTESKPTVKELFESRSSISPHVA